MSLTAKKVNYIFKPLNLNIIVDKLFFWHCEFLEKRQQTGADLGYVESVGLTNTFFMCNIN